MPSAVLGFRRRRTRQHTAPERQLLSARDQIAYLTVQKTCDDWRCCRVYDAAGRDVEEVYIDDGGIVRLAVRSEEDRLGELENARSPEWTPQQVTWNKPSSSSHKQQALADSSSRHREHSFPPANHSADPHGLGVESSTSSAPSPPNRRHLLCTSPGPVTGGSHDARRSHPGPPHHPSLAPCAIHRHDVLPIEFGHPLHLSRGVLGLDPPPPMFPAQLAFPQTGQSLPSTSDGLIGISSNHFVGIEARLARLYAAVEEQRAVNASLVQQIGEISSLMDANTHKITGRFDSHADRLEKAETARLSNERALAREQAIGQNERANFAWHVQHANQRQDASSARADQLARQITNLQVDVAHVPALRARVNELAIAIVNMQNSNRRRFDLYNASPVQVLPDSFVRNPTLLTPRRLQQSATLPATAPQEGRKARTSNCKLSPTVVSRTLAPRSSATSTPTARQDDVPPAAVTTVIQTPRGKTCSQCGQEGHQTQVCPTLHTTITSESKQSEIPFSPPPGMSETVKTNLHPSASQTREQSPFTEPAKMTYAARVAATTHKTTGSVEHLQQQSTTGKHLVDVKAIPMTILKRGESLVLPGSRSSVPAPDTSEARPVSITPQAAQLLSLLQPSSVQAPTSTAAPPELVHADQESRRGVLSIAPERGSSSHIVPAKERIPSRPPIQPRTSSAMIAPAKLAKPKVGKVWVELPKPLSFDKGRFDLLRPSQNEVADSADAESQSTPVSKIEPAPKVKGPKPGVPVHVGKNAAESAVTPAARSEIAENSDKAEQESKAIGLPSTASAPPSQAITPQIFENKTMVESNTVAPRLPASAAPSKSAGFSDVSDKAKVESKPVSRCLTVSTSRSNAVTLPNAGNKARGKSKLLDQPLSASAPPPQGTTVRAASDEGLAGPAKKIKAIRAEGATAVLQVSTAIDIPGSEISVTDPYRGQGQAEKASAMVEEPTGALQLHGISPPTGKSRPQVTKARSNDDLDPKTDEAVKPIPTADKDINALEDRGLMLDRGKPERALPKPGGRTPPRDSTPAEPTPLVYAKEDKRPITKPAGGVSPTSSLPIKGTSPVQEIADESGAVFGCFTPASSCDELPQEKTDVAGDIAEQPQSVDAPWLGWSPSPSAVTRSGEGRGVENSVKDIGTVKDPVESPDRDADQTTTPVKQASKKTKKKKKKQQQQQRKAKNACSDAQLAADGGSSGICTEQTTPSKLNSGLLPLQSVIRVPLVHSDNQLGNGIGDVYGLSRDMDAATRKLVTSALAKKALLLRDGKADREQVAKLDKLIHRAMAPFRGQDAGLTAAAQSASARSQPSTTCPPPATTGQLFEALRPPSLVGLGLRSDPDGWTTVTGWESVFGMKSLEAPVTTEASTSVKTDPVSSTKPSDLEQQLQSSLERLEPRAKPGLSLLSATWSEQMISAFDRTAMPQLEISHRHTLAPAPSNFTFSSSVVAREPSRSTHPEHESEEDVGDRHIRFKRKTKIGVENKPAPHESSLDRDVECSDDCDLYDLDDLQAVAQCDVLPLRRVRSSPRLSDREDDKTGAVSPLTRERMRVKEIAPSAPRIGFHREAAPSHARAITAPIVPANEPLSTEGLASSIDGVTGLSDELVTCPTLVASSRATTECASVTSLSLGQSISAGSAVDVDGQESTPLSKVSDDHQGQDETASSRSSDWTDDDTSEADSPRPVAALSTASAQGLSATPPISHTIPPPSRKDSNVSPAGDCPTQ